MNANQKFFNSNSFARDLDLNMNMDLDFKISKTNKGLISLVPIIIFMLTWENQNEKPKEEEKLLKIEQNVFSNSEKNYVLDKLKESIPDEEFLEFFNQMMSKEIVLNKEYLNVLLSIGSDRDLCDNLLEKFIPHFKHSITDFVYFAEKESKIKNMKESFSYLKNLFIRGGETAIGIEELLEEPFELEKFETTNIFVKIALVSICQLLLLTLKNKFNSKFKDKIVRYNNNTDGNSSPTVYVLNPNNPEDLKKINDLTRTFKGVVITILQNGWCIILIYFLFKYRKEIQKFLTNQVIKLKNLNIVIKTIEIFNKKNEKVKEWIKRFFYQFTKDCYENREAAYKATMKAAKKIKEIRKILDKMYLEKFKNAKIIKLYQKYINYLLAQIEAKNKIIRKWELLLKYLEKNFPDFFKDIKNLPPEIYDTDNFDHIDLDGDQTPKE